MTCGAVYFGVFHVGSINGGILAEFGNSVEHGRKRKAFMSTQKHFDDLCGCNIYELLTNILENSTVNLI